MQVISFSNSYASPIQRLAAHIIDHLVMGCICFTILLPFHNPFFYWHSGPVFMGWVGADISYKIVSVVLLEIIYYSFMEASNYQGTVGKIALGLKVVDTNGQRIAYSTSLLRTAAKFLLGFLSYILILFNERRQGLHDMVAGTFVTTR